VNLEADIYFPEDQGVIQIENFGVHIDADGTVLYGMLIEAVMDRIKDGVSLDHLSRLLVDIHQDSSRTVDSFISTVQLKYLDLIFSGDRMNRDKMNIILCDAIVPTMSAMLYMDGGERENELKQVIGSTKIAYDISDEDVIIFGAKGILVGGKNARVHDRTLVTYAAIKTKDMFATSFYARVYLLLDRMAVIRHMLRGDGEFEADPQMIRNSALALMKASAEVLQLEEVHAYLKESLSTMKLPEKPKDKAGVKLFQYLDIGMFRHNLQKRVTDLSKTVNAAKQELEILSHMQKNCVSDRALEGLDVLNDYTNNIQEVLCDVQSGKQMTYLLAMVISGELAFQILDRMTGTWTVISPGYTASLDTFFGSPFLWFILSVLVWGIVWQAYRQHMKRYNTTVGRANNVNLIILEKMHSTKALEAYLETKGATKEKVRYTAKTDGSTYAYTWKETDSKIWRGGALPTITIEFDFIGGFLLTINAQVDKGSEAPKPEELREEIMHDLHAIGALEMPEEEDDGEEYE